MTGPDGEGDGKSGVEEGRRERLESQRMRRGSVESGLQRRACGWWRMTTVVEVGRGQGGR